MNVTGIGAAPTVVNLGFMYEVLKLPSSLVVTVISNPDYFRMYVPCLLPQMVTVDAQSITCLHGRF